MDLDDKLVHYLLVLASLGAGSVVKIGFDRLARRFWRKIDKASDEFKEFQAWKVSRK